MLGSQGALRGFVGVDLLVPELDSLLYACTNKPSSLCGSELLAMSPGGGLVMPLGSPGEGGLLGRGRFWVIFSASLATLASAGRQILGFSSNAPTTSPSRYCPRTLPMRLSSCWRGPPRSSFGFTFSTSSVVWMPGEVRGGLPLGSQDGAGLLGRGRSRSSCRFLLA